VATSAQLAEEAAAAAAAAAALAPPAEPAAVTYTHRQVVTVEAKKAGLLIGPKGSTKIGIQTATETDIAMPKTEKDQAGTIDLVVTGGTESNVGKAVKAILDLCQKGYTALLGGDGFCEGSITVQAMYLPEIIGKGGANIRAIQDQFQVRMQIPPTVSPSSREDGLLPVKIGVVGNKDRVALAKNLIKELTMYRHTPVTHPGMVHKEVEVDAALHRFIIGTKGSEIKHINNNFKVHVYIPSSAPDAWTKNILVVGEPANVDAAERYILKIVDDRTKKDDQAEQEVSAFKQWGGEEEPATEEWMQEFIRPQSQSGFGDISEYLQRSVELAAQEAAAMAPSLNGR